MDHIEYKSGYKYQLVSTYKVSIPLLLAGSIQTQFITLTMEGLLTVRSGYAWDGPTWLADTKNAMRASLVHDALYQLMRSGRLDLNLHRNNADKLFRVICREDGMGYLKAFIAYRGLFLFARSAADPKNQKPIIIAP